MFRPAVALVALLVAAAPAAGLSIPPPGPEARLSADGRFVLLFSGSAAAPRPAADIQAALDRRGPHGLYRRGAWDAPLWAFPTEAFGLDRLFVANDGVHLVAVPFHSALGDVMARKPFTAKDYHGFRAAPALRLFARGKPVRTVTVADVTTDPERLKDDGGRWLEAVELDDAAGVVRVRALDGNRTTFALATGERVEGRGAAGGPIDRAWWAAATSAGLLVAAAAWALARWLVGARRRRPGEIGSPPAARVDDRPGRA